jgi:hypothetical protein
MLTPLEEPKRRRARFHAYDLEWFPGTRQLRLIGVKDAVKYRSYVGRNNAEIVEAFFEAELTKRHRGDWFYAHAGGLADIQFLLEYLIDREDYNVEASFSGSSAVIVRVSRGGLSWLFVDSLFTLKEPLAKIGERLGPEYKKGEVSWDAPIDVLRDYNEQDCTILFEGIRQFEDILIEQGSELRMTLASCAMRMFRRRYLKDAIPTHNALNKKLRPAYVGGRVEVFYRKPVEDWQKGQLTPGYYYDVNSCYPWAMTKPLPERYLRAESKLPRQSEDVCYFADLTVDVPESQAVPVLPYVWGGSLYFPTGRFRGWFCGPEIERALETGTRIVKVHECLLYRPFHDLAHFAEDFYRLRMQAKGFHNYVFKILLNSCYGKFGERGDKVSLLVNPSEKKLAAAKAMHRRSEGLWVRGERERALREPKKYEKGRLHMITPGAWMIERSVPVQGAHVPIAAYVTSWARALLHRHLVSTSELPYYCDTDGFMLPPEAHSVPCEHDALYCPIDRGGNCPGCLLGGVKREKIVADAMFFAPKLYYLLEESGHDIVRAKGFGGICNCLLPLGQRRDADGQYVDGGPEYRCPTCGLGRKDKISRLAFERIISGKAAVANRMLRIRQLYGRGLTAPTEHLDERQVEGGKPKRLFEKDGTSRPWNVDELWRGENEK